MTASSLFLFLRLPLPLSVSLSDSRISAFRIRAAGAAPSLLRSYGGRRQNFQVPRKTAKMTIENMQTIVIAKEENYHSRTEHSFAVAAGRKF